MTVSNFFASFLRSVNVKKPITVVSNGTDTNLYKPQKLNMIARSKYGISKAVVAYLYIGRLDRDKNVATLV